MAVGRFPAAMGRRPGRFRLRALTVVWTVCFVVGIYMLGSFAYGMWNGISEQHRMNHSWQYQVQTRHSVSRTIDRALEQPVDGVDFAIRVPKLGYYAAVKEGVDSGVLYASPGHYPSTRWPGNPGTVGVAAHNVYWINFPELVKGDEIDIETRYGVYRYRVTGTRVVNPDDRTVLLPDADGYHLTLTTCWPLWAGAFATQRYIIFADQVWPTAVRPGDT